MCKKQLVFGKMNNSVIKQKGLPPSQDKTILRGLKIRNLFLHYHHLLRERVEALANAGFTNPILYAVICSAAATASSFVWKEAMNPAGCLNVHPTSSS